MTKRLFPVLFIVLLIPLMMSCPDPGSSETQSSSGTQGIPGNGEAGGLTAEQVARAAEVLLKASECDELLWLSDESGSGVVYVENPDGGVVTFSGVDINGFDFNTAGFQTLSGTITYIWTKIEEKYIFDITLTGGDISRLEFTLDFQAAPGPVAVTVDGEVYAIPFPGGVNNEPPAPEGIPDFCHITYDTQTNVLIHNPHDWILPLPESHHTYLTAYTDGCQVETSTTGSYTYPETSYGYPYHVTCRADASSSFPGSGTLEARTDMTVEGFRGNTAKGYQAHSTVYHHVYFTARSNNPETTKIEVSFHISASGRIVYSTNDHAQTYASLGVDADIYRMGWIEDELDNWMWEMTDRIYGDQGSLGYAVTGFTDADVSRSGGIFEGNVSPGDSNIILAGSETIICEIEPEKEMLCLCLDLAARSSVQFSGINLTDRGIGTARCLDGRLNYSCSATDPDHPGAEITVDIYIPDF